jgi:hypothetical protein
MEALHAYVMPTKKLNLDKKEDGFCPNRALDFSKLKLDSFFIVAAITCLEVGEPEKAYLLKEL